MTILPFLVVVIGGAAVVVALRRRPAAAAGAGLVAALLGLFLALAISPGQRLALDGGALIPTAFGRLVLVEIAGAWLLLAIVEIAARGSGDPGGPAGTLAGLAGLAAVGVAVVAVEPVAATWVVAGGSIVVLGAAILGRAGRTGVEVSANGLRALAVAAALSVAGIALGSLTVGGPDPDLTSGRLAFLGVTGGLALRSAAVPVHGWAARLADVIPSSSLAPLLAWLPAVAGVVALAWVDAAASPFAAELGAERTILVVVGIATIGLASLAAWLVDDLGHIVTYLAIAAAGLTLLGVAAIDPATWAPTRSWVVVAAVGLTALVGWVVALEGAYGSRRLPDLAGWARRSPVLAVALALATLALVGAPGLAVLSDRLAIVDGAIAGPAAFVVRLLLFAPLVGPARALAVGLRPIGPTVAAGASEWPRRPTSVGPAEEPVGRRAGRRARADDAATVARQSIAGNRTVIASAAVLAISVLAIALAAGLSGLGVAAAGVGARARVTDRCRRRATCRGAAGAARRCQRSDGQPERLRLSPPAAAPSDRPRARRRGARRVGTTRPARPLPSPARQTRGRCSGRSRARSRHGSCPALPHGAVWRH